MQLDCTFYDETPRNFIYNKISYLAFSMWLDMLYQRLDPAHGKGTGSLHHLAQESGTHGTVIFEGSRAAF